MDGNLIDQPNKPFSRSYVIELVGPAGAGKTSLAFAMSHMKNQIIYSNPPNFHDLNKLPFFAVNAFQTVPHLAQYVLTQKFSQQTPTQIVSMVILNGWYRCLYKKQTQSGEILLLDQGPVYLLTDLFEINSEVFQSNNYKKWRENMYQQWAHTLDLVIWLDAPDSVLISRINEREKQHIMKERSEREVHRFLSRSRRALDQTVLKLSQINRSLKIIEFDTSEGSPVLITSQILVCLGLIEDLF
jgi:shikimate kinase